MNTSMENNLDGILPLEEACKNIPTHKSKMTNSTLEKKSASLEDNLDGTLLLPLEEARKNVSKQESPADEKPTPLIFILNTLQELKEACKNIPTHESKMINSILEKKSTSLEDNLDGILSLPLEEVWKNVSKQENPADEKPTPLIFTFDTLQELEEACENIPTNVSKMINSILEKKSTSLEDNLDGVLLLPLEEACKNVSKQGSPADEKPTPLIFTFNTLQELEEACKNIPTHESKVTNSILEKQSTSLEDNLDGPLLLPLEEARKNVSKQESPADEKPNSSNFTFDILQELDFQRSSWSKIVMKDEENRVQLVHGPSSLSKPLKKVDVHRNLTVKVILGNVTTAFVDYDKIDNLDHLHELLDLMETINLCPNAVCCNRSQNCVGYLSGNNLFCVNCRKFKKNKTLKARNARKQLKKKK